MIAKQEQLFTEASFIFFTHETNNHGQDMKLVHA